MFLACAHLRKRAPVALVGHEHGVVAERAAPVWRARDDTGDLSAHGDRGSATARDVRDRRETRGAVLRWHTVERAQERAQVVGIRGVLAGEAGGTHTGR